MHLALGSGKTLCALCTSILLSTPQHPIIAVMSKTLVTNWECEIRKFFGDSLPYQVLHQERIGSKNLASWVPAAGTRMFLTTPEFLTKAYRLHRVDEVFIYRQPNEHVGFTNVYRPPDRLSPVEVYSGPGLVYTMRFGCLIVDEAQGYCNILADRCRCIASLCVSHRWLLSGTMFSEPKAQNLLGYHVLLNIPDSPTTLVDMEIAMRRPNFPGLRHTLVHRERAQAVEDTFVVRKRIVQTPLSEEEATVLRISRDILREIRQELNRCQDERLRRRYSAYLLAMVTYLRQMLVAPIIVLASVALDVCCMKDASNLSSIIMDKFREAGLSGWLDSEAALRSSRCMAVMEELRRVKTEYSEGKRPRRKVLIFSGFRVTLRLMSAIVGDVFGPDEWSCFHLEGSMSMNRKKAVLDGFEAAENGLLFMTYKTGSEGLNLQYADTVFLVDSLWNATAATQAIARVARQGQTSAIVEVLTFISDAGIEKAVYDKQSRKLEITDQLMDGGTRVGYHHMKISEILDVVLAQDVERVVQQVNDHT